MSLQRRMQVSDIVEEEGGRDGEMYQFHWGVFRFDLEFLPRFQRKSYSNIRHVRSVWSAVQSRPQSTSATERGSVVLKIWRTLANNFPTSIIEPSFSFFLNVLTSLHKSATRSAAPDSTMTRGEPGALGILPRVVHAVGIAEIQARDNMRQSGRRERRGLKRRTFFHISQEWFPRVQRNRRSIQKHTF